MNQKQRDELSIMKMKIDELRQEEEEKYDNAPEGLQGTDRVEKFQDNADALAEIYDLIDELLGD